MHGWAGLSGSSLSPSYKEPHTTQPFHSLCSKRTLGLVYSLALLLTRVQVPGDLHSRASPRSACPHHTFSDHGNLTCVLPGDQSLAASGSHIPGGLDRRGSRCFQHDCSAMTAPQCDVGSASFPLRWHGWMGFLNQAQPPGCFPFCQSARQKTSAS